MSDPTSQDSAVLCVRVQPAGRLKMSSQKAHAHKTHVYTTCIHMTDIQSTHIHRQQQQPHPVPLSGWARWGSMRDNICTHTYELDPSNSLVQTLSLPAAVPASQSPQLLALAHTIPKATAPLQLLVQMTTHTHTHRVDKDSPVFNTWALGLWVSWDRPRRGQENPPFPTFSCSPLFLWVCAGRFLMVWWHL